MCRASKYSRTTLLVILQQFDIVTRGLLDRWVEDFRRDATATTTAGDTGATEADRLSDVPGGEPVSLPSQQQHHKIFQELLHLALRLKVLADLCSKKYAHVTLNRRISRGVTSLNTGVASFANKGALAVTQEEYVSPVCATAVAYSDIIVCMCSTYDMDQALT